ncbi:ribonuclease P protein component [bacterium]|nr:ribonuclease P protein component [bacterium]
MLPRENRLRKNKDIKNVLTRGKPVREDFLFLKIVKNGLRSPRFAIVVGKNLSKKAVVRNKLKRRISEIIRIKLKMNEIKPVDGVVIALPGAERMDFSGLKQAIEKIFAKAKLI